MNDPTNSVEHNSRRATRETISRARTGVRERRKRHTARRRLSGRRIIGVLLVAVLCCFANLSDAQATGHTTSKTWSGIVDSPGHYTVISGTFTIPQSLPGCGARSTAAIFVGLGGYAILPFAQNGITVTPGGVSAWYELFDKNSNGPEVNVSFAMKPGDVIQLVLEFTNNHNTLTFTWSDLTKHTRVQRVVSNASKYYSGVTADWIVERAPYDPVSDTPWLDRFTPITFTNAWTSEQPTRPAASPSVPVSPPASNSPALPATLAINMVGKYSLHYLDVVTPSTSNNKQFTVSWANCA